MLGHCFNLCFASGAGTAISRAEPIEADVCVYGGTSGGAAAAEKQFERDRWLIDGQALPGTT